MVRADERLPAGRRVVWTIELLVEVGREWQRRHNRLPRASDWTVSRAQRLGGDALGRLRRPPAAAPRWPPASTINDAFGSWARYRVECGNEPWASKAPAARYAGPYAIDDEEAFERIHVHGDAYVIDGLREHWLGPRGRYRDDEWRFLAWAILDGHALLPNVALDPTADIESLDRLLRDTAETLGELHVIFPDIAPR